MLCAWVEKLRVYSGLGAAVCLRIDDLRWRFFFCFLFFTFLFDALTV